MALLNLPFMREVMVKSDFKKLVYINEDKMNKRKVNSSNKDEKEIKVKMNIDRKKDAIKEILSKRKNVSFNSLIEIRNFKKILIAAICCEINS